MGETEFSVIQNIDRIHAALAAAGIIMRTLDRRDDKGIFRTGFLDLHAVPECMIPVLMTAEHRIGSNTHFSVSGHRIIAERIECDLKTFVLNHKAGMSLPGKLHLRILLLLILQSFFASPGCGHMIRQPGCSSFFRSPRFFLAKPSGHFSYKISILAPSGTCSVPVLSTDSPFKYRFSLSSSAGRLSV